MNQFLIAFLASFGLAADSTQEQITAKQTEITNQLAALRNLSGITPEEVTRLKGLEAQLTTAQTSLTALTEFKNATLTAKKAKVTAIYNKITENKPTQGIVDMINNAADMAALDALEVQYQTQLEEKYPSTCKKCGSKDITKASATQSQEEATPVVDKTSEDAAESFREKHRQKQAGSFFGTKTKA